MGELIRQIKETCEKAERGHIEYEQAIRIIRHLSSQAQTGVK